MRELKFRGLRNDNGVPVWEYGLYVFDVLYPSSHQTHRISPNNHEVDENTIGQFSGLKDKNGVEIYEGDIVVHNGEHCVINFKGGSFGIDYQLTARSKEERILSSTKWEVLGNCYENPELLKP